MDRTIHLIPTAEIAAEALTRDRTALDPAPLDELRHSILATGLRMPVELFAIPDPDPDPDTDPSAPRYGLISGFRRLAAFRALTADGLLGFDTIPAFLRTPATLAEAMIEMVEENAIRADVSPWEQALVAVRATESGLFDTIEAAIDGLYTRLSRDKRYRYRSIAHLVADLYGSFTAPENLSLRQLLRLAAANTRGYGDLMRHALLRSSDKQPETQWRLLLPILAECEDPNIPDPRPERGKRDRPRRLWSHPRHDLHIRRQRTVDGWCLHFTGKDAHGGLIEDIMTEIELQFSPG
jgi:ParB family chromosome partitioning protein